MTCKKAVPIVIKYTYRTGGRKAPMEQPAVHMSNGHQVSDITLERL